MARIVLTEVALAPMAPPGPFVIPRGAVAVADGRVAWAGAAADRPGAFDGWEEVALGGRLVTPALVDCHTHLIHAGHRAGEWEMRLAGAGYEEIARAGGGILSTVRATRAATEDELVRSALPRLDDLLADGVGTVEVKSGYGLDLDAELRMLRAARRLAAERPVGVVATYLGAHAVPPEFEGRAGGYIAEVCVPALRAAHAEGLADAVDGFCEGIAFSREEIARLWDEAEELDLPRKLHAEQLSHGGGAAFAAERGAISADHLEHATDADARIMARHGTVAVLLPGAFYSLRERQAPPVAAFRAAGTPMAVATDLNPGSSPIRSLRLAMNMACTLFGLTVAEAWEGATGTAARALGLLDRGRVARGLRADLAVWDAETPAEVVNAVGGRMLHRRMHGGAWC